MNMIKIHNVETGEIIEREMNAKELKEFEKSLLDYEAKKAEAQERAEARQAILDRLGLTADEAKLLLG